MSHDHASITSSSTIKYSRVAQVGEIAEMAIVERVVDCVVDVAFVDVVGLESRLDFGEFVQLFGKVSATVSRVGGG
jgi:hypothetical protein